MKRSGFSMIELVFVIVILGVLAAVAVPRFVATRTDAQVATARSDLASAQKAIVAKVFADNIDTTLNNAPDPNKSVQSQGGAFTKKWGDWIIEISGLDGSRWETGGMVIDGTKSGNYAVTADNGIQPIGNIQRSGAVGGRGGCGMVLGISIPAGMMVFSPNNIGGNNVTVQSSTNFCYALKMSYQSSNGPGNKIIPLAATGTVEF